MEFKENFYLVIQNGRIALKFVTYQKIKISLGSTLIWDIFRHKVYLTLFKEQ
jgi:hypothetical protein